MCVSNGKDHARQTGHFTFSIGTKRQYPDVRPRLCAFGVEYKISAGCGERK